MGIRGVVGVAVALTLTAAACGGSTDPTDPTAFSEADAGDDQPFELPDRPELGSPDTAAVALIASIGPVFDLEALRALAESGDPRWAWMLTDLLLFYGPGALESSSLVAALERLTDFDLDPQRAWNDATTQLIDADIDAPPEYPLLKRQIFGFGDPRWTPMLTDVTGLDLRYVSWGGVFPDDRPFGTSEACPSPGCIPALDEPAVTDAAGGDWYDDDAVVFGLVINGEARAFPKNIMQVHEMVNDTLGGRQYALPYCTLCGSAQAYLTDNVDGVDGRLVLRTSGLLQRSNKVMFDLNTGSLWDTFAGTAASGPLGTRGVELEELTVEVSTWGDWQAAHPGTTIVAEDGGIGRAYSDDPLDGRDDLGPIFPIGAVDPRLPVQEPVVTVTAPDGTPVAFPTAAARTAIHAGLAVSVSGVTLVSDGAGFRAVDGAGSDVVAHEAFWFAWVQRNPDTVVWEAPS